ncbi:LCP family protein [Synechococcus sp. M16CYN]
MLWPEPDQVAKGAGALQTVGNPANLAPFPAAPVMVLVVGIDANELDDRTNQAAPLGPANADTLLLVRIAVAEPLQVLQIPIDLAVQLPGSNKAASLSSLWLGGGVFLLNNAIQEIVGLPDGTPQRYVVMPRRALRTLVDGLGNVDVTLDQAYQSEDKTQAYSVKLQAGPQSLNGVKAEQLARYREDKQSNANRRIRQQKLILALVKQLKDPGGISMLPRLVNRLDDEMETNLSRSEQLGLAAALIASPTHVDITQLQLAKRVGSQTLRQIKPGQTLPLWPQN